MDGKVVPPDALIARAAERQYGVITAAQMRRMGVSDDAVRARVLSGRLHRVHRGVYAVGHAVLSAEGRCMAAVLAVGGRPARGESVLAHWGAAVSHRSAAMLWGLLDASGPVNVLVGRSGGRAKRRGLRVHRSRSLSPEHVTLRRGIPVTTPARTVADLRTAISLGRSGAISEWELRKAIRQANVLGLPIGPKDAKVRTRSDLEADFLRLCRRHQLPRPEVNVRVGPYLIDFLWRERRLVVETDSYLYHRGEVAFRDDHARDLELMRRGFEVVRLSELQLDEEPAYVAEVLAARLGLPADAARPG